MCTAECKPWNSFVFDFLTIYSLDKGLGVELTPHFGEDHGECQYTHRVCKAKDIKPINTICRKKAEMSNVKTG
jgi:hypothetical protein